MVDYKKELTANVLKNVVFQRNKRMGSDACEILAHAIQAVDPYACVSKAFQYNGEQIFIGQKVIPTDQIDRIFLLGFGKAAVPMAKALVDQLGEEITQASVITKDPKFLREDGYQGRFTVFLGDHPIPSERSVESTRAILRTLPKLTINDLVLIVISGGGSALFTDPIEGVNLGDMQRLMQSLLSCGADIHEINTIRKHLDQVKGGRLAERLQPALVETFILSDVIGDQLDMIASGPTVPDPTTYQDSLNVIRHYDLQNEVPSSVIRVLNNGLEGLIPETLKPRQLSQARVSNHLVGTNFLAASAALKCSERLGYHSLLISTALTGLTKQAAEFLGGILHTQFIHDHPATKPACLIFGGETTVNVTGEGLGGRNMDLALRMVPKIAGKHGVLFVSLATDGEDGPTDAAGAVVDGLVLDEGKSRFGMCLDTYIQDNDSYHYFEKVGGLIKTCATGTNVNDIMIMLFET